MADSTLDPDNTPESDRRLGIGHGKDALGPSDTSDSGSDVQGGLRAVEEQALPLDRGTHEDPDSRALDAGSDTDDSTGTGESSTAGRNADVELAGDIGFDRIDHINPDENPDLDDADIDLLRSPRPDAPRPEKR